MKIIAKPDNYRLIGHDGLDYFFVREWKDHATFSFRNLRSSKEFGRKTFSPSYQNLPLPGSGADYTLRCWRFVQFEGLTYIVKNGELITLTQQKLLTVRESCLGLHFTATSPTYFIYTPAWNDPLKLNTFIYTLELFGQHHLANRLQQIVSASQPREMVLISNRITGEIQLLSLPFVVVDKAVIAIDEQTIVVPGHRQLAIIDLDF